MKKAILLLLFFVFSCNKEDKITIPNGGTTTPSTTAVGGFTVETPKEIVSKEIGATGGEITVSNSNTNLDGMKIEVPSGAYSSAKIFKISTGKITKHDLGSNFNPISPLIRISNGGEYANEGMTLTIPIKLPQNHFAMAFVYNKDTKQLDFLPILSLSRDKIVVSANNFAKSNINKSGRIQADDDVDIMVSSTDEKNLGIEVSTNFKIGVDDWEFSNRGSIISPAGICSGMTRTAMYYFNNIKPKTGKPLWGNTDYGKYFVAGTTSTEDKLWFDNAIGIRFATVVQSNQWLKNFQNISSIIKSAFTDKSKFDKTQFLQIAYYFLISENPSPIYLSIKDSSGKRHAILVIGKTKNSLIVADPNRNGERMEIPYDSSTDIFGTYRSGYDAQNVKGLGDYTDFICFPRSFFDDIFIESKYKEVENRTIGNDIFEPSRKFDLVDTEEKGVKKLATGLNIYGDFNIIYNDNGGEYAYKIYDNKGNKLHTGLTYDAINTISLPKGQQKIGIITFKKAGNNYEWADFQWFDVNVLEPKVFDDKFYFSYELDGKISSISSDKGYLITSSYNPTFKLFEIVAFNSRIRFEGIKDVNTIKEGTFKIYLQYGTLPAYSDGVWIRLDNDGLYANSPNNCIDYLSDNLYCETPGFIKIEKINESIVEGSFEFTYSGKLPSGTYTKVVKNGKFRAKK